MIIQLQNVKPDTLKDKINPESNIWNKTISFEKGEKYLIKAISGSGKSTFINIAYGIRKDYSGDVIYNNESIKNYSNNDFSEIRNSFVSIVFQDLRLFLQLTAKENILINSQNKQDLSTEQLNWIEKLGITALLDRPMNNLSYGERQRFALVRALSQPFSFLLLDEPFSHLDRDNAKTAYSIIEEQVQKYEAGLIMTSLGNEDFLTPTQTLLL